MLPPENNEELVVALILLHDCVLLLQCVFVFLCGVCDVSVDGLRFWWCSVLEIVLVMADGWCVKVH